MSELDALRRDFVANVSHELRTPVAVIRANAETLLEGALDDAYEGRKLVEAIERNAERLTELISDLLDLSRIEAGNYGLSLRSLRASKAIGRAIEAVAELAAKRDVTLHSEVDPALHVWADKRGFDQILINLLDNAVKHSPPGSRVLVRAAPDARGVRIEVEDAGAGVQPRHRDRVFERFFRADPGRSRDKGGTGLGLAIVKHLTDLMSGQVGVRSSREPSGAVFWFVLPSLESDGALPEPSLLEASPPGSAGASISTAEERARQGELRSLRKRLVRMAARVVDMTADAIVALQDCDAKRAARTLRVDVKVHRDEIKIDALCAAVLNRFRLNPSELRFLTVALKMVADLERIGDLCASICHEAARLSEQPVPRTRRRVQELAAQVLSALRDAVDAFVDADAERAMDLVRRSECFEPLYADTIDKLTRLMASGELSAEQGGHLLFAARSLERIAHRATRLAEQVVFMVEGRDIRHGGSETGSS